jgi:hypothetical protein
MQKLLDFVNIDKITYGKLETFYRHHRIFFSEHGMKKGSERYVSTKQSDKFFSFDHIQDSDFLNDYEKSLWFQPTPENEKALASLLKVSQQEYRSFLDSCIFGDMDGFFVSERMDNFSDLDLKAIKIDNFKFNFDLQAVPKNLEEHIDLFEILYPLWRGEGETFGRVKKCKFCENYFFAVSLKAEFCARKCRNAFNYRKK